MFRKYSPSFAILAPVVYVFATVLGGAIWPGYSHIANAISELTTRDAPNLMLMNSLFTLYNVLLTLFGLRFMLFALERQSPRIGRLGAVLITLVGLLGMLMYFFPMDPVGTAATLTGTVHLVLAGLLSLGTILSTLFTGLWLRKEADFARFGTYTLITCAVIVVTGGFAAAAAANASPVMGLAERLTIGTFMQWLFVLGLRVVRE